MSKQKKYLLLFFVFVACLIIFLSIIYNSLILGTYSNKYFSVDYKGYNLLKKDKKSLLIKNSNGSVINIVGDKFNKKNKTNKKIYSGINDEFLYNNKSYSLVNMDSVKVGKKYKEGYQYLYEGNKGQCLLVIVILNESIVKITYSASSQYFDFDLDSFYSVINSIDFSR